MSVARAQTEIDSREFGSWLAFNEIEPTGSEIDDIRLASLKSFIGSCHGANIPLKELILIWDHGESEPADRNVAAKALDIFKGLAELGKARGGK